MEGMAAMAPQEMEVAEREATAVMVEVQPVQGTPPEEVVEMAVSLGRSAAMIRLRGTVATEDMAEMVETEWETVTAETVAKDGTAVRE